MRQLKFRVWDETGFLNSDAYCLFPMAGHAGLLEVRKLMDYGRMEVLPNAVMSQWTELTDKNGVEIYEGDILERIGNVSFRTIVIYWNNHDCRFVSKNSFNLHGRGSPISNDSINISDSTGWVVCGNIYENSELL